MFRRSEEAGPLRIWREGLSADQRSRLAAGAVEWIDEPEGAELVLRPVPDPGGPAVRDLGLTDREVEVLGYLADGWSNEEIASRLRIGATTVKYHLAAMYRKLGVNRRTEAVREGQRLGMIEW